MLAIVIACALPSRGQVQPEKARPGLSSRDVVSAANYSAGTVTPGQVLVLYPSSAGPSTLAESHLDQDGKMATSTGDTRVLFDGIPAPIVYAAYGHLGVIVPYGLSEQKTTSLVIEYQGLRSDPLTLPVVPAAPALYTLDSSGKGQAAMLNQAGCCNSARNPAAPGSVSQLFATGAGQTTPRGTDGLYSDYSRLPDYPKPQLPVTVTVGGIPAEILYAGEASLHVAGTFVVNFRVPPNAPVGDAVPIVLAVGESRSPDGVTMAIRSAVERVLLLDRDPVTRQALGKAFRDSGFQVSLSQSGEIPPDLLICDLEGNQALIQSLLKKSPQMKVVVILSTPSPENLRAADLAGAQAVVTKPFAADRLLQRARELLAARAFP